MTTDPRRDAADPDGDTTPSSGPDSGPNSWLVDEMYRQYLGNPRSVPEEWQEVFRHGANGATPPAGGGAPAAPAPAVAEPAPATATAATPTVAPAEPVATPAPASTPAPTTPTEQTEPAADPPADQPPAQQQPAPPATADDAPAADGNGGAPASSPVGSSGSAAPAGAPAPDDAGDNEPSGPAEEPIRGVGARIAANMEASLEVPTATSFREIPAKLLEVNRRVLNNHLGRIRNGKVSFTHLIGYAVVKAIAGEVPNLNNTYRTDDDGKPVLVRNEQINVGIAVDQQKADGSRSLIVPVIKGAESMDFAQWVQAYEGLITKVRDNKIAIDDLMGATISITNPGTIGTVQSVPRLMPGQGAIIGVGRIGYPAEFEAADPKMVAPARAVQDHHHHLNLRPSHHPGGRVGPVPEAGPRAAAG